MKTGTTLLYVCPSSSYWSPFLLLLVSLFSMSTLRVGHARSSGGGIPMRSSNHFIVVCLLIALLAFGVTSLSEASTNGGVYEDGNNTAHESTLRPKQLTLDSALLQVEHQAKSGSQRVLGLTPIGEARQTYGSQGKSITDIFNDKRQTSPLRIAQSDLATPS